MDSSESHESALFLARSQLFWFKSYRIFYVGGAIYVPTTVRLLRRDILGLVAFFVVLKAGNAGFGGILVGLKAGNAGFGGIM